MNAERVEFSKEEIALLDGLSHKLDYLPLEERPGVMSAAAFMMAAFAKSKIPDRDSGQIWASHSIRTMEILADWHLPAIALEEGGLHDVVEDTADTNFPVSLNDLLATGFSPTVVDGVGRLGIVKKYHDKELTSLGIANDEDRDKELRSRFFEALVDHPSVVLVRIAERLDNLKYIRPRYLIAEKQSSAVRTATESLRFYLPFLWELGMYDIANLYAHYALAVLYSEADTQKLSTFLGKDLPTFNGEQELMRQALAEIMGINLAEIDETPLPIKGMSATKLSIYPPSYRVLANLLAERKYIKHIKPQEVPYLADVVYEEVEEVGRYFTRLKNSRQYYFLEGEENKFWQEIGKGDKRAYYLTIIPKPQGDTSPSPIRISFLTQDMLITRQASILHSRAVSEIDDRLKIAADIKVEAVSRRIREARPTGPSRPERVVKYDGALRNEEMITVNYSLNGKVESVQVKKRSSVMDVLVETLSPAELMHCRSVKMRGKKQQFNQFVSDTIELEIDIDTNNIYLSPYWLDDFRQLEVKKRAFVKSALRNVIDGDLIDLGSNFLTYPVEYRERVFSQARQRALVGIEGRYADEMRDSRATLRLSVESGFDPTLREIYGYDREKFLVDAGIGAVAEKSLDLLVRNLVDLHNKRLIRITLYVPLLQDMPGWQRVLAEQVQLAGMNTRILDGGGSNDEGIAMFITHYCDPPLGVSLEELPHFLDDLRNFIMLACRQSFNLPNEPPLIFVIPAGLRPKSA